MVRAGHEQRPIFIPDAVDFAIGEDVVPAGPRRRGIQCVLEVLVDGDSTAWLPISAVTTLDENGICPVVVDYLRLVDAAGAEELIELLNLATDSLIIAGVE